MQFIYNNWSYKIFEGFYQSQLYDIDFIDEITANDRREGTLTESQYYDIDDFNKFQKEVAKSAVMELNKIIKPEDNIIKSLDFKGIHSPQYYNYETNRLIINIHFNLTNLKKFCFKTHRESFNQYLKDNFTSYPGFVSFIANDISAFEYDFKTNISRDREIIAMLEYYLLTCIYESYTDFGYFDTQYHQMLYDDVHEITYESLVIIDDTKEVA